jgi:hypothetical protein
MSECIFGSSQHQERSIRKLDGALVPNLEQENAEGEPGIRGNERHRVFGNSDREWGWHEARLSTRV